MKGGRLPFDPGTNYIASGHHCQGLSGLHEAVVPLAGWRGAGGGSRGPGLAAVSGGSQQRPSAARTKPRSPTVPAALLRPWPPSGLPPLSPGEWG